MKKGTIGIIFAVLVVAGMVVLLASNKKKMQAQQQSVSADNREVVTIFEASEETLNRSFSSNGVAQAMSELNFVSEISGRVVEIYVDKGSRVSKGTPLLRIDSDLLKADYKANLASYETMRKDAERFTRSYEAGGVTSQQLDNIQTQLIAAESRLAFSKWKLDNAVVKAPIAGTINMRYVETGALIAPNAPLFEIVDGSRIKVTCNVPESKVRYISVGQKVTVTGADAALKVFSGTVKSIGVKTDRGLNYPVEVALDRNEDLRIGMYLKVNFSVEDGIRAILIPRKAVVGSVLSANVYVAVDGKAEKREVKLGEMFADKIEILEGLQGGEKVILSGLMNISDGSEIRIVEGK